MRRWVATLGSVLAAQSSACIEPMDAYPCTEDAQCVVDDRRGSCEPAGFCAFPDAACPRSQKRYGPDAGDLTDACVPVRQYFVAQDGNDDNPGTEALPFQTLGKGVRVLVAGDVLNIKTGLYEESLTSSIPGGTSWEQPVSVVAYPGHEVTLHSPDPDKRALEFDGKDQRYIEIEGLRIDGSGGQLEPVKIYRGHIRLRRCEITGSPVNGIYLTGEGEALDGGYNELIELDVHDNALVGISIGSDNNLVEGCTVAHHGSHGISLYSEMASAQHNVVRGNRILDSGSRPPDEGKPPDVSLLVGGGDDNFVHDNLVYIGAGIGIHVAYGGARGTRVLHNTVFAHPSGGIAVDTGSQGTRVLNNIVFESGESFQNLGVDTEASPNFFTGDPLFANAAAGDFHLDPASAAVDSGVALPEVTTDFDGTPRPQGAGYDMGAFER